MTTIALVAHNNKKTDLLNWVKENHQALEGHNLIGTTNTSRLINDLLDLKVQPFGHGPSGGDILLAARILQGEVHKIIFFIDAETPHGHEHDIQTLIRTAVLNNIPIALNRASADLIVLER